MIPKPIYDFLPTIYVVAGALLAAEFHEGIGKGAALVLVLAGVLVFNMRINGRVERWVRRKLRREEIDMNWSNAYYTLLGQPKMQAALIGLAWLTGHDSGNAALLSNLLCNMLHPTGVCQTMDAAGIPLPAEAELESLRKDAERYRWLRDSSNDTQAENLIANNWEGGLDSVIDAAIAAAPKEK